MSTKSILGSTLLALQLCLGFWQIMKLTPGGGLIQASLAWCLQPLGLSSSYTRLQKLPGRIFKAVPCCMTTAADQVQTIRLDVPDIKSSYLNIDFHLERREENMLLVNGAMTYYITDEIWYSLQYMAEAMKNRVFIKGYKEFCRLMATSSAMSLLEVLDYVILDNHAIRSLSNTSLLPVNLSVSEEKLLKVLNLMGLFLQTKEVYWLIPLLLSFTAAILEFCTSLRVWLYAQINALFCWVAHLLCERLPRQTRVQVYSLGIWVENLTPGNDIESRVVRGNIRAVIGGGAKLKKEDATLVQHHSTPFEEGKYVKFPCEPIGEIGCIFINGRSLMYAKTVGEVEIECDVEAFERLIAFISCMARNGSGSLRCCNPNNVVRVRSFRESVICYAKSGFPPVYEMELENIVVK